MTRRQVTLRIDAAEHAALKKLSKVEGRPVNQLVIEAVKAYLATKGPRERELEATLASLRACRQGDPGFKRAITAFVEAEAGGRDPIEGVLVEGKLVNGQLEPVGPVQGEIRALLDA